MQSIKKLREKLIDELTAEVFNEIESRIDKFHNHNDDFDLIKQNLLYLALKTHKKGKKDWKNYLKIFGGHNGEAYGFLLYNNVDTIKKLCAMTINIVEYASKDWSEFASIIGLYSSSTHYGFAAHNNQETIGKLCTLTENIAKHTSKSNWKDYKELIGIIKFDAYTSGFALHRNQETINKLITLTENIAEITASKGWLSFNSVIGYLDYRMERRGFTLHKNQEFIQKLCTLTEERAHQLSSDWLGYENIIGNKTKRLPFGFKYEKMQGLIVWEQYPEYYDNIIHITNILLLKMPNKLKEIAKLIGFKNTKTDKESGFLKIRDRFNDEDFETKITLLSLGNFNYKDIKNFIKNELV